MDFNPFDKDHVARKIAMARINDFNRTQDFPQNTYSARLPILQEGIRSKPPYFEVSGISGVSLRRPTDEDYENAASAIEFRGSRDFSKGRGAGEAFNVLTEFDKQNMTTVEAVFHGFNYCWDQLAPKNRRLSKKNRDMSDVLEAAAEKILKLQNPKALAAQDMFEALEACQEYLKYSLGSTSEINPYPAMNAALAKARGEA